MTYNGLFVIASLKPYYYYLIGEGKKTEELRKTVPLAKDWNGEVLFYMTKDEKSFQRIPDKYKDRYRRHFGKVGMQVTVKSVQQVKEPTEGACIGFGVTKEQLEKYSKGKPIVAWKLSNPYLFNYPKEIDNFHTRFSYYGERTFHRPPQSWQYTRVVGLTLK